MLARDAERIGNDAEEGLGYHGEISRVLEDLKRGRVDPETVLEEEVDSHPWETPKPLHPEPYA